MAFDFIRANRNTPNEAGYCERWAEQGFGFSGLYPSAIASWTASPQKRGGLPPSNGSYYLIYFDGWWKGNHYGDVAIYKNGSVWSGSDPKWRSGTSFDTYKRWIGTAYLGWSEYLGSKKIATFPASTTNPKEKEVIETQPPVFNTAYYNKVNPDVPAHKIGAQAHWLKNGIKEGRPSAPNFHVKEYIANYQDLQRAFGAKKDYLGAVKHYFNNGINEGRIGRTIQPSPDSKFKVLADKVKALIPFTS